MNLIHDIMQSCLSHPWVCGISVGVSGQIVTWAVQYLRRRPPLRDASQTAARCVQSYQDEQARAEARVVADERKSLYKALPRDLRDLANAERRERGMWTVHVPGYQPVAAWKKSYCSEHGSDSWWLFDGKYDIRAVLVATAKEPEPEVAGPISSFVQMRERYRDVEIRLVVNNAPHYRWHVEWGEGTAGSTTLRCSTPARAIGIARSAIDRQLDAAMADQPGEIFVLPQGCLLVRWNNDGLRQYAYRDVHIELQQEPAKTWRLVLRGEASFGWNSHDTCLAFACGRIDADLDRCKRCNGSGIIWPTSLVEKCPDCAGTGKAVTA